VFGVILDKIERDGAAALSLKALATLAGISHGGCFNALRNIFGRSWSNSRQSSARRLKSYAANDPERTSGPSGRLIKAIKMFTGY
jgi:hypothetical protein